MWWTCTASAPDSARWRSHCFEADCRPSAIAWSMVRPHQSLSRAESYHECPYCYWLPAVQMRASRARNKLNQRFNTPIRYKFFIIYFRSSSLFIYCWVTASVDVVKAQLSSSSCSKWCVTSPQQPAAALPPLAPVNRLNAKHLQRPTTLRRNTKWNNWFDLISIWSGPSDAIARRGHLVWSHQLQLLGIKMFYFSSDTNSSLRGHLMCARFEERNYTELWVLLLPSLQLWVKRPLIHKCSTLPLRLFWSHAQRAYLWRLSKRSIV